jgi:hypothetical protein
MEMYLIYNEQTKGFYAVDKNPRGYAWKDFEKAYIFRGPNARSRAYTQKRELLQIQGYSQLKVKKYNLKEVEDV